MILVGESDPNAREVPFRLPDETDPRVGVTGHVFTLGEVKIRTPGAPYVNVAVIDIVEKGYGDYAARLTGPQATVEGFTYLYANIPGAQLWTSVEQVGLQPNGVLVGETVDVRRELAFHLPDFDNPLIPFNGGVHVFSAGEVKICLPGGVYADADVSRVVSRGFGDFALQLTDAQVLAKGKAFLRVSVAGAQEWTAYYEIVEELASSTLGAPIISNITPTNDIEYGLPGAFSATFRTARLTPITFHLSSITLGAEITIAVRYGDRNEAYVARNVEGVWCWPFDLTTNNTMSAIVGGECDVSMMPRGGWPNARVEFLVAAAKKAVPL